MSCYARMMQLEDVGQVAEIDREAFSTQWPPPNYKRELQNNLSHYVVAIDDARMEMVAETQTAVKSDYNYMGIFAKIRRWFGWRRSSVPQLKKDYVIGFAGIWMIADEAHVTSIAVREKHRGRKIGELLLIALTELAINLKARTITLEVRVSNSVAQNLYAKYGFTQVGLRRGYYADNREDALLMSTQDVTSGAFQERFMQLKRDYHLTSRHILRENNLSGKL